MSEWLNFPPRVTDPRLASFVDRFSTLGRRRAAAVGETLAMATNSIRAMLLIQQHLGLL